TLLNGDVSFSLGLTKHRNVHRVSLHHVVRTMGDRFSNVIDSLKTFILFERCLVLLEQGNQSWLVGHNKVLTELCSKCQNHGWLRTVLEILQHSIITKLSQLCSNGPRIGPFQVTLTPHLTF